MGNGCVVSALFPYDDGLSVMMLSAVPDQYIIPDWRERVPFDWAEMRSWRGQTAYLTFPNPESIDRIIEQLHDLRDGFASAIEARSGETGTGSTEGESAPEGDAQ
jgi:hypothetical protein